MTKPSPLSDEPQGEICRDEACSRVGIHARGEECLSRRGRKPKVCPTCKEPLHRTTIGGKPVRRCDHCPYSTPD